MRGYRLLGWLVLLAGLSLVLLGGSLLAAPQAALHIDWWSVDAGGGTSASGALTLYASMGQLDAGSSRSSATGLGIDGGFWVPTIANYTVALPVVLR